ncbi:hypothetical protein ACFC25_10045 [Pseudarthrobacter sp. NPDC055928]|uniref:hypothetical protein n=1 Tax=Pseudarthrobacter sp. NPDC055928 TaxID=3345661 RepID=UPI0035DC21AE
MASSQTPGAVLISESDTSTVATMISMQGVNKHFGPFHVLRDMNLELTRGQVGLRKGRKTVFRP